MAMENAMLALERQRMLTEDLAAHALAGRVTCNPGLDASPAPRWIEMVDDQRERSRLALQRFEVIGVPNEDGFQRMADEVRDLLDPDLIVDIEEYADLDEPEEEP
jgi:hypothetical protein